MTDRRRQLKPVRASASRALTVAGKGSTNRRSSGNANPNRRISAFLAHLALEYDGMAARRVLRSQALEAAIESYGAQTHTPFVARARPAHDLKI